jgi:murein L,D-transpeptidase YcbB/YkuD
MTALRLTKRAIAAASIAPAALMLAAFAPVAPTPAEATIAPAEIAAPVYQPKWSRDAASDLLEAIQGSAREGLTPADYDPAAIRTAMANGDGEALDAVANAAATALARDYLLGRVQNKAAYDWHIERSAYEAQAATAGLDKAIAAGDVRKYLNSLLPSGEQYVALRNALADASDPVEVARIRANMERWRWMPRQMGDEYIFVNIPTYELSVMKDGVQQASYDVVVGAPKTPTPSLAVPAQRVVVNPWWTLPPSVLAEGKRYSAAKGYTYTRAASGKMMVRQKPGPMNALGRVKIDMPNEHAIYLHDTPAKAAFARKDRALSHGCIRVQGIDQLASELESDGRVEEALAGADTRTIGLSQPVPVYIVYLTTDASSGTVKPLADIYGRDAKLIAALDNGAATRLASAGAARVMAAR